MIRQRIAWALGCGAIALGAAPTGAHAATNCGQIFHSPVAHVTASNVSCKTARTVGIMVIRYSWSKHHWYCSMLHPGTGVYDNTRVLCKRRHARVTVSLGYLFPILGSYGNG